METVHPFIVVMLMFFFAIVLVILSYFTNIVVGTLPTFPAGSYGNAIVGNYTAANSFRVYDFNLANEAVVIILLAAMFINLVISYTDPNIGQGLADIIFLFIVGAVWLFLKISIQTIGFINTLNAGSGVTNTAYNLFLSPYFITVVAFMIVLAAILNFRNHPNNDNGSAAYNRVMGDIRSTEGIR